MMDLIGGYLLIILILFGANISLLLGNYKINNIKLGLSILLVFIVTFCIINYSNYFNHSLSFLMDYFSYLFLIVSLLLFTIMFLQTKEKLNSNFTMLLLLLIYLFSIFCLTSQTNLKSFEAILYSLFLLIILFVVFQLTKLLHHAKRPYNVIVGEYMGLFSILMFIFSLTYNSTKALDYSMFSSFLILTPLYQLIYILIAIVVILIVGFVLNDSMGGNS